MASIGSLSCDHITHIASYLSLLDILRYGSLASSTWKQTQLARDIFERVLGLKANRLLAASYLHCPRTVGVSRISVLAMLNIVPSIYWISVPDILSFITSSTIVPADDVAKINCNVLFSLNILLNEYMAKKSFPRIVVAMEKHLKSRGIDAFTSATNVDVQDFTPEGEENKAYPLFVAHLSNIFVKTAVAPKDNAESQLGDILDNFIESIQIDLIEDPSNPTYRYIVDIRPQKGCDESKSLVYYFRYATSYYHGVHSYLLLISWIHMLLQMLYQQWMALM